MPVACLAARGENLARKTVHHDRCSTATTISKSVDFTHPEAGRSSV
jgi:hypothetical protein